MRKLIFILGILLVYFQKASSQSWGDSSVKQQTNFAAVEVNPKFPGGLKGFYDFVSNNLKVPKHEGLSLVKTTVNVKIYISITGNVDFAEIIPDPWPSFEKDI